MSAAEILALRCDVARCKEFILAQPRESVDELRRRSMRDHGWRYSAPARGSERDLCRWHA